MSSKADKYNLIEGSAAAAPSGGASKGNNHNNNDSDAAAAAAAAYNLDDLSALPLREAPPRYLARRPWLYSLCHCCSDCDSCLEANFCFFCQLSRQYNMTYNLQPEVHWPLCAASFALNYVFGNTVSCLLLWSLRGEIRHRYGIEGGNCGDCCTSWCCGPCALQQHLLEMSALGAGPGAFCGGNGTELRVPEEPLMI